MVQVTALLDNKPSENKALIYGHGLSLYIEKDGLRMLFDCGFGTAAWQNAHRLGKTITGLDAVILSHSHYDHAAGYRDLIEGGGGSTVLYTGSHFFEPKYARNGVLYTDLSAGFDTGFLRANGIAQIICEDILPIAPGMWLVGNFPRTHPFETIPSRFVKYVSGKEGPCMIPDPFEDEICLAIDSPKGLHVFVGCSHPGILNMIEKVHISLKRPVFAVYGGTHLMEANESRIRHTIAELKDRGLSVLGLSHCSGDLAEQLAFREAGMRSCHLAAGGTLFIFDGGGNDF